MPYKQYLLKASCCAPRSTRRRRKRRKEEQAAALAQCAEQSCASAEVPDNQLHAEDTFETYQYDQDQCSTSSDSLTDCAEVHETQQSDTARKAKKKRKRISTGNAPLSPTSFSTEESSGDEHPMFCDTEFENSSQQFEEQHCNRNVVDKHEATTSKSAKSRSLCPCTKTTVHDVLFMTLCLGLRHSLTWDAQVDILKMHAKIHDNVGIPTTKASFLNRLNIKKEMENLSRHVFCADCEVYLGESSCKKGETMKCTFCQKEIVCSKSYFVSLSIESQLKDFMQDPEFVKSITTYRFNRKKDGDSISDVYDGNVYKKLCENNGVLSSPLNFSFNFFTDGVPFGKNSNKTIWPIYLTINELPYEERSKYLILAGVYAGPKDPSEAYFLKPFVEEVNKLSSEGFSWTYQGVNVISRVIPLCCICDSVARPKVINFQIFHARFGCTYCYKQSVGGKSNYVVSEISPLRTKESLHEDLREVFNRRHEKKEEDQVFRGVKGPCNLLSLNYFSVTTALPVDFMHALLIGVTRAHLELILQATNKNMWVGMNETIGMEHLKKSIDNRITAIQSNTSITRGLRPLKDFKLWKANECKAWLIFYAIPCLKGLLKKKYLVHLCMLSKAANILLQKSALRSKVEEAHKLFMLFTFYYQEYFGEQNMTYNLHLLSHICKNILDFGPMLGFSGFLYEAENRYLLQFSKSPFAVALEISRKFMIFRRIPFFHNELHLTDISLSFVKSVLHYKRMLHCERANNPNCVFLGTAGPCSLLPLEKEILLDFIAPVKTFVCRYYEKVLLNKKRYTTTKYSNNKQKNDACALLKNGRVVIIRHIVRLPSNDVVLIVQYVKIAKLLLLGNEHVKFDTTRLVDTLGEVECIKLDSLSEPCLVMDVEEGIMYVSKIPYGCTVE